MKNPIIILATNNVARKESCPVCGGIADAEVPFELFLDGTRKVVCDVCAKKHAPELKAARNFLYERFALAWGSA